MTVKINQKIKSYKVLKKDESHTVESETSQKAEQSIDSKPEVVTMHEKLDRPEVLFGSTYKIKAPVLDHAMYVTINDMILNPDTEHEERRPFEIFINSKEMDQFQWVVALTRILSAVFRKGGDVAFLVEEMKAVFDPHGGYFKSGGVFVPSLVAEIGMIVETHFKHIGLIEAPELTEAQKELMAEKRKKFEQSQSDSTQSAQSSDESSSFPPGATLCPKCHTKALVVMDGCQTCLNCGHSKCG